MFNRKLIKMPSYLITLGLTYLYQAQAKFLSYFQTSDGSVFGAAILNDKCSLVNDYSKSIINAFSNNDTYPIISKLLSFNSSGSFNLSDSNLATSICNGNIEYHNTGRYSGDFEKGDRISIYLDNRSNVTFLLQYVSTLLEQANRTIAENATAILESFYEKICAIISSVDNEHELQTISIGRMELGIVFLVLSILLIRECMRVDNKNIITHNNRITQGCTQLDRRFRNQVEDSNDVSITIKKGDEEVELEVGGMDKCNADVNNLLKQESESNDNNRQQSSILQQQSITFKNEDEEINTDRTRIGKCKTFFNVLNFLEEESKSNDDNQQLSTLQQQSETTSPSNRFDIVINKLFKIKGSSSQIPRKQGMSLTSNSPPDFPSTPNKNDTSSGCLSSCKQKTP